MSRTAGQILDNRGSKSLRMPSVLRPIHRQVLITVNLPLLVLIVAFLSYDYSHVMRERLKEKHITLEEEAHTILPAVHQLHHYGVEATQQYIDAICAVMQSEHSPGHHIAVQLPGTMLQATSHGRASPEMLTALQHAADSSSHRASLDGTELIVGLAKKANVVVYVTETLSVIKHTVRWQVISRLVVLFFAFLLAAMLVNIALLRSVTQPIQQLVTTVQQIGNGQLGVRAGSFRNAELDYLAAEIDSMSTALAAADRDHKSHMAKARDIQQHLLPKDVSIPGLRIAHLFQPADEIGGDYYDILPLQDGSWLVCVADVTGHGIPAALSAAMLKTLVLHAVESHASPAELLEAVNRKFIAVSLLEDFVSMLLLRVDTHAGRMQYASAGHEPGWLIPGSNQLQELPSTGLLLGIDEEATWREIEIDAAKGDRLIALTDGVSETFNAQGEIYGRSRLSILLQESSRLTIEQTAHRIDQALRTHRHATRQHDDITAVLLELT